MTLGNSFLVLGEARIAAEQFEAARAIYTKHLGVTHRDTLRSMNSLAMSYGALGRDDGEAAVKLFEETLALQRASLGPEDLDTLYSMANLAISYFDRERYAEAIKLYEEVLPIQRVKLGPHERRTLTTMNHLANCYSRVDRLADAIKLRQETLALQKAHLGPEDIETLWSMSNLAAHYRKAKRYADALPLDEETFALRKKVLTADHPDTLGSMWGLAKDLINLGRGSDAVPILDDCLRRSVGKRVHRNFPEVADLRLRHFQKAADAAECRRTAELWEKQQRTDAASLYQAAVCRVVTAALLRATDKSPDAIQQANTEADRALAWLQKAVAAGYKDVSKLHHGDDWNVVRDRADFRKLLTELEAPGEQQE